MTKSSSTQNAGGLPEIPRQQARPSTNTRSPAGDEATSAIERVAAVLLNPANARWSEMERARRAAVGLAEWRAVMADPLLIATLEEAWRCQMLGAIAPAIEAMARSARRSGRDGHGDRALLMRLATLLPRLGEGERDPPPALRGRSDITRRLEAAKAHGSGLPAPGMDSTVPPSEAIDADYVMEPAETDSGETTEFM